MLSHCNVKIRARFFQRLCSFQKQNTFKETILDATASLLIFLGYVEICFSSNQGKVESGLGLSP